MKRAAHAAVLAACCALAIGPAAAQQGNGADVAIQGYIFEPIKLNATETRVKSLKLPEGFKVEVFASGLINPRMLAVSRDGTVYVTRRSVGDVVMLKDTDNDGRADRSEVVATRPQMHGITIKGDEMYLATIKDVYRTRIQPDGTLGELQRIIDDLPDAGQHPNRTLAIGPDNHLYITVGSTCNACAEPNPENATILRAKPDGSQRTIYASGLRNTIGFDWHPDTKALYGWDHGIDWLGNDAQLEEINRIEQGRQYGWPYIYDFGAKNPQDEPPGEISHETWAKLSQEPVLGHTAHSAGMQLLFYTGEAFPPDYRGDAFVTLRGSWNRKPASGYEVVRIRFENGEPKAVEPFITGFLTEENGRTGYFGRPVGLAQAPDGSLLFTDDVNGVIYRVSRQESATGGTPQRRSAVPLHMPSWASLGNASGLLAQAEGGALAGESLKGKGRLTVTSAFGAGQRIPFKYTDFGEKISPPLAWSGAPEGTRSFVLIMEDPDATEPKPFTHWLAYNIPADTTSLPEGVPPQPRLLRPEGVLQGANSRGSIGYFGPRPPDGDPPHRYHVQIFALDTMLRLDPAAKKEELVKAMQGRVLAQGEIVGTFEAQPPTGAVGAR